MPNCTNCEVHIAVDASRDIATDNVRFKPIGEQCPHSDGSKCQSVVKDICHFGTSICSYSEVLYED